MKNRSRIAIMTMILQAANDGASLSSIMYEIYLSSRPLKAYLNRMVEEGLLTYDGATKYYRVTPKGLGVRRIGERILSMIPISAAGSEGKTRRTSAP